ncbi:MAG: hypothetical protein Q8869_00300, partial [Candidatus Phytoplasma australasiaticum]|nr:hypothetical protein [Candidatus Phytoplasma australasiaticum]
DSIAIYVLNYFLYNQTNWNFYLNLQFKDNKKKILNIFIIKLTSLSSSMFIELTRILTNFLKISDCNLNNYSYFNFKFLNSIDAKFNFIYYSCFRG